MHQQLQWIVTMMGSLFVLVMATRAFAMCAKHERGAAASMLAGTILVSVVFFPSLLTNLAHGLLGAVTGGHDTAPKPSHRPHTDPTGPHIPWTLLLAGLAGLVALGLLGGIAAAVRARHLSRTAERRRRAELQARHDTIRDAYADFTADILAVIDRPALNDVSVSQTERLILALDAARDARSTTDTANYRARVNELEIAWRSADQHARKTGTKHLADNEQRIVQQARHLLATALDTAGNAHERHIAYQKAIKLISNIIDIPRGASAAVEAATRHALPAT